MIPSSACVAYATGRPNPSAVTPPVAIPPVTPATPNNNSNSNSDAINTLSDEDIRRIVEEAASKESESAE
ncbi:MAG: hypothetical protein AAGC74_07665 [Verrucomicrobiota bacterium]